MKTTKEIQPIGKKPVSIILIGWIYILAPLFNIAQALFFTELPLFGDIGLFNQLRLSDWAILFIFPVVGIGMLQVKPWGWVVFTIFTVVLMIYNLISFFTNFAYSLGMMILFNFSLALVTMVFFRKHLRAPYFNPRLRWWEADPRFPALFEAELTFESNKYMVHVEDFSKSGIFISTNVELDAGTLILMEITGFDHIIPCKGKVMRRLTTANGSGGFGIMFVQLDKKTNKQIVSLIRALVKFGARERNLPANHPGHHAPLPQIISWYLRVFIEELVPRKS